MFISEYRDGVLVKKEVIGSLGYEEIGSPKNGTVLVVPDFSQFTVKLIIANEGVRISTEIPIFSASPKFQRATHYIIKKRL